MIQIVSYLTNKLPEGVLNYLRSECVEEHSTEFGKDIKVYPVDEVTIKRELLMEWGYSKKNYDGLVKKNISFKWEETKVNETKVFEVFVILYVCTYFMMIIFLNTAESSRTWLARAEIDSSEQQLTQYSNPGSY